MTDISETTVAAEPSIWTTRTLAAAVALAALVIAGDILIWYRPEGVNVLVFFVALIAAVAAVHPHKLGDGRTVVLIVVALLGVAPFFETLSPWALLTAQGGITLLALGISDNLPRFEQWGGAFTRFGLLAPFRFAGDGFQLLLQGGQQKIGGRLLRGAIMWIVPVAFACVFIFLFSAANPVIEYGLRFIRIDKLLELLEPGRIILWGIIAVGCWPLLAPKLLTWSALPPVQGPMLPRGESLLFGRSAILNSLVLFNALFAVQTVLDLIYLWGGVRLPDDISYAVYAHRGAHPLIVTALLAAAFVLAAMRRDGPGQSSPLIRNLVYLWIAQNIWLVISSVLRLKLYVEVYYLSEMRIAAFIWMGLVAVGLVLIVAKIALNRTNSWLVMSNMAVLSVVLWGVAWIDFKSFIAFYNVRHSYEVTGKGVSIDQWYMSELGPDAIPAIDEFLTSARFAHQEALTAFSLLRNEMTARVVLVDRLNQSAHPMPETWQGWTWREERLEAYLVAYPFAPDAADAID
jgi:hypothetical protein